MSAEEVLIYDSIDGRKTVAELEEMHTGAADSLLRWREIGVVELISPVSSPAHPHLVVIEPHMDDAVLGAGGRLLNRRGRFRITILSVVKWTNFTSYLSLNRNFINVQDITNLRQQESALAAMVMGAEARCLDWSDALLRFWPAELWSSETIEKFMDFPRPFMWLFPTPGEISLLCEQLMKELKTLAPDELWIPMGLGEHVDHAITRNACLMMLAEARDRFVGVPVVMYEDFPYSLTGACHGEQIRTALAECGARFARATEDISDVFEDKVRLGSVYASQFKRSYIEPKMRELAARDGGGSLKLAEAYYCLEGKACLPLQSSLSWDWAGMAVLHRKMSALLIDRIKWRRLTVIAFPSGHLGRWKTETESLVAAFPNAEFTIYASEKVAWQAEEGGKNKLAFHVVRGGWWGWIGVIGREMFRFRVPTVILWRGAFGIARQHKFKALINMSVNLIHLLIKLLFPFRRLLFAKTLSDFCGVLIEQVDRD